MVRLMRLLVALTVVHAALLLRAYRGRTREMRPMKAKVLQ
jgi:hypothetical protein